MASVVGILFVTGPLLALTLDVIGAELVSAGLEVEDSPSHAVKKILRDRAIKTVLSVEVNLLMFVKPRQYSESVRAIRP